MKRLGRNKNFTWIAHIPPPPHLKFALIRHKTQVCGDQASLVNVPLPKSYHNVVVDVAHMFLGVAVHRSFQSPPERLVTKNTRRTTYVKNMFVLLFEKGNKTYANLGHLLVLLCLLRS
jgi:hypothetical protein